MPLYHHLGQISHKRHTQFKKADGRLYREELMGLEGFSSIQSLLYHYFMPPGVADAQDLSTQTAEGSFASRNGIDRCDISLHPYGLPHGPQPGMTKASIGKKDTNELAVLVDTFHPLHLTRQSLEPEKKEFMASWPEGDGE
jgi:hypothetical protein